MDPNPGSLVGKQVGNYAATKLIGRGSMGEVYEGNHPILDKRVAIKVLSQELSAYPELVSRFRREARAIARIKHPAIVEAFDFGNTSDGRSYYVMELLKGTNLSAFMLAKGALPLDVALCIALPLMEGLSTAHEAGFIHRDIKPDNIFLVTTEDGKPFPKLIDFGIAKLKNPDEQGDSVVTRIDAVMGTPLYMSPEQAPGATEPVGPWSDIYSTAATIFHMICGKPPFYSDNPLELMLMHSWTPAPRAQEVRPDLPTAVSDVLLKALGKKPADRYPTMQAFTEALRAAAPEAAAAVPSLATPGAAGPGAAGPGAAGPRAAAPSSTAPRSATPSSALPRAAAPSAAMPSSAAPASPAPDDEDADSEDISLGDTVMEGLALPEVEGVLVEDGGNEGPRPSASPSPSAPAPAAASAPASAPAQTSAAAEVLKEAGASTDARASTDAGASMEAPRLEDSGPDPAHTSLSGVASEKVIEAAPSAATLFQRRRSPWPWALGGGGAAVVGAIVAFLILRGGPTPTKGPARFTQMSTKTRHTCAVGQGDGEVRCWGRNNYGQLGLGDTKARTRPSPVGSVRNVRQVAVGGRHTCSLDAEGSVHCWGRNHLGQLGDGTGADQFRPVQVKDLGKAVAISAGADHTCAMLEEGSLRCWGNNDRGQLGLGEAGKHRSSPQPVRDLKAVIGLAAGGFHTCALAANGSVWCWGRNDLGQLGVGDLEPRAIPAKVEGLADVIQLSAGGSHTCSVTKGGAAHCWGDNASGQLGDGTTTSQRRPVPVGKLPAARQISAGGGYLGAHTCAVTMAQALYCWGSNAAGQLGSEAGLARQAHPRQIPSLTKLQSCAAGGRHTCALADDGQLHCWGDNGDGQLGDGSGVDQSEPRPVR